MHFNDLDKKTQEYIKSLEHQIDAQKEIIHHLELENAQYEKYMEKINEMLVCLKEAGKEYNMNHSFEYVTSLEYCLKAALNKIAAFERVK